MILEEERCFQKAVQILYERVDLLSSEELIFYYRFVVSKARRLYVEFVKGRGGRREEEGGGGDGGGVGGERGGEGGTKKEGGRGMMEEDGDLLKRRKQLKKKTFK